MFMAGMGILGLAAKTGIGLTCLKLQLASSLQPDWRGSCRCLWCELGPSEKGGSRAAGVVPSRSAVSLRRCFHARQGALSGGLLRAGVMPQDLPRHHDRSIPMPRGARLSRPQARPLSEWGIHSVRKSCVSDASLVVRPRGRVTPQKLEWRFFRQVHRVNTV
jgi:hypothetical protein